MDGLPEEFAQHAPVIAAARDWATEMLSEQERRRNRH